MVGCLRWAGVVTALALTAGLATAQEALEKLPPDKPPAPLPPPKPLVPPSNLGIPPPKSVLPSDDPRAIPPGPPITPYTSGCGPKGFSDHWLGRLGAWLCYHPICSRGTCDCGSNDCRPPLFTYFQCSRFYQWFKPVCCDTGCGGKICGTNSCGPKGPITVSFSLPSLSVGRGGGACCPDAGCADGAVPPPPPAPEPTPMKQAGFRVTGDPVVVAPTEGVTTMPRTGLLRGWCFGRFFGGGACGGGRLFGGACSSCGTGGGLAAGAFGPGGAFGKHPCPMAPPTTKVDLANMPVLAPDGFKTAKPGCATPHGPDAPTPVGKMLMDKARAELKRGDYASAREIATEARNGSYGVEAEAAGLLRAITALGGDGGVRQTKATEPRN